MVVFNRDLEKARPAFLNVGRPSRHPLLLLATLPFLIAPRTRVELFALRVRIRVDVAALPVKGYLTHKKMLTP
jgi:hypothetical protein